MSAWINIGTAATVYYPTGNNGGTLANSRTTVAADSALLNAAWTTIKGIQVGPGNGVGTLSIFAPNGTTVIRTIAVPNTSTTNMSANYVGVEFSFPGGFSASSDGATPNIYIQYEYQERWT